MMKRFPLIAFASLIALSSAAQAQTIDLNSMPLGNFPPKLDSAETGSIPVKKVLIRTIDREGTQVTQRYTVASDGAVTVISEQAE
jgi:hypothetical protein